MDRSMINKWVKWSFNFDIYSLEGLYTHLAGGDAVLAAHIKAVFERDLSCCGRAGVANQFFCDIDKDMQERLLEWIDLNFEA